MKDVITSEELAAVIHKKEKKVFRQRLFKDDPGNSLVFAAPKTPGLKIGDIVDKRDLGLRVSQVFISGEYKQKRSTGYGMVVNGSGSLDGEDIEAGDLFIAPNGFTVQAGNGGVSIVLLEIVACSQEADVFLARKILHSLKAPFCSKLPQLTKVTKGYGVKKYESPSVSIVEMARIANVEPQDLLVALNSVTIEGETPIDEELHHHRSHIFAIVSEGEGILMEPYGIRTAAKAGDGIIVPVGTKHYFEAPSGRLYYCGIEFGKEGTDYQKHFHE